MTYGNLRDGDAVVTAHGLIFYVFGYDHPDDAYHAFLKYVPEERAHLVDAEWLDLRWRFRGSTLLRPRELYSPEGYARLVASLRRSLPDYAHFSPELGRWMIAVPRRLIEEAYMPSRRLTLLLRRRGPSDPLEEKALVLIRLLSSASSVPMAFFGVHGSIALGMHHEGSDIDTTVYGGANFRMVRAVLPRLEEEGRLGLERGGRLEAKRLNSGVFEEVRFVVNATRRFSEIPRRRRPFTPLGAVDLECRCRSAEEAVFRPAVYQVEGCRGIGPSDPRIPLVSEVVSMIGLYRGVVEEGEGMRVKGVLEEAVDGPDGRLYRVVVGSGAPDERLDWLDA